MSALPAAFLRASLIGSLVALFYLVFRRIASRRLGLLWREILCSALIAYLLVPIGITTPISLYSIMPSGISPAIIAIPGHTALPASDDQTAATPSAAHPIQATEPISEAADKKLGWAALVRAIWAIGFGAMLVRMLLHARHMRTYVSSDTINDERSIALLREAAQKIDLGRMPTLCRSSAGPAVRGVLRPEILMPDGILEMPSDTVSMIFLHECTHIKRFDVLKLWVLGFVDAIYWWNPMIRLSTRYMRKDLEMICDSRVLRCLPYSSQHLSYGRALIATAAHRTKLAPAAAGSDIKERINMIKTYRKPRFWITVISFIVCGLLAAAFLTLPPAAAQGKTTMGLQPALVATPLPSATYNDLPVAAMDEADKQQNGSILFDQAEPDAVDVSFNEEHSSDVPQVRDAESTIGEAEPTAQPQTLDNPPKYGAIVEWDAVNGLWLQGETVTVVDYRTRKSFTVTRVTNSEDDVPYNMFHADFEPTTAEDTAILKKCYGGKWSWNRRPVLVFIDNTWIAASINGMPHGQETIEANGALGLFCMHFRGSLTHGSATLDDKHQRAILAAAGQ